MRCVKNTEYINIKYFFQISTSFEAVFYYKQCLQSTNYPGFLSHEPDLFGQYNLSSARTTEICTKHINSCFEAV